MDDIGEVLDEAEVVSPQHTKEKQLTSERDQIDSHRSFNTRLLMKAEDIIEKLAKKTKEREK